MESELLAAFEHYFTVFLTERDVHASGELVVPWVTGFGTGRHEKVYEMHHALHLFERDVDQVPDPIEYTLHHSKAIPLDENTGLVFGEMDWHMSLHGWQVSLYEVRVSVVMKRYSEGWRVVHKHMSQPTAAHGDEEPYPLKEMEAHSKVLERRVQSRTQKLEQAHREMRRLAVTDALTGLYNRVQTDEVLDAEIRRQNRQAMPLAVILLDIDYFKPINDRYGHSKGDQTLIRFAQLLSERCRETDCLGRWGGEEFLLVCPDTTPEDARMLADQLLQSISECDFALEEPLTASIGVTSYRPGDTREMLIERADRALYEAKKAGRNQVSQAHTT